jgi:hypothetical protein
VNIHKVIDKIFFTNFAYLIVFTPCFLFLFNVKPIYILWYSQLLLGFYVADAVTSKKEKKKKRKD